MAAAAIFRGLVVTRYPFKPWWTWLLLAAFGFMVVYALVRPFVERW